MENVAILAYKNVNDLFETYFITVVDGKIEKQNLGEKSFDSVELLIEDNCLVKNKIYSNSSKIYADFGE